MLWLYSGSFLLHPPCLCGCLEHASPTRLSATRYYANSLRHAELPAHSMGITTHQRELMGVGWDAEQRQFEARIWTRWGIPPHQLQRGGQQEAVWGCGVCAEAPQLYASTGVALSPMHHHSHPGRMPSQHLPVGPC